MLSFLDAGTAIGPVRPATPVALGWGVGVSGRAETTGLGAVVGACTFSTEIRSWLFGLCLEESVLMFLTSVWEVTAAGEIEEDTNRDISHNQRLP